MSLWKIAWRSIQQRALASALTAVADAVESGETLARFMGKSRLAQAQIEWGRNIPGGGLASIGLGPRPRVRAAPGQERNALLLASTLGEHNPGQEGGFFGSRSWSRDRLRQLDLRDRLRRDTAVLIGFADDPGFIRLFGTIQSLGSPVSLRPGDR